WFFDFYISRPLAFGRRNEGAVQAYTGKDGKTYYTDKDVKWRWWGNVRVASFPQPGHQTLAETVGNPAAQIGALTLSPLAQGAEFLSGLEYQVLKSIPFRRLSENTRQVFTLGVIGAVGATGFFTAPSSNAQVFTVPTAGSPQAATFTSVYGNVT